MIIDGKKLAEKIKRNIKSRTAKMKVRPGLAVILAGKNPASKIYVASKERACERVGFYSKKIILSENVSQKELLKEIEKLNNDEKIHGILVQLPLPKGLDEEMTIQSIKPEKDVDCFHPINVGKLTLIKQSDDLNNFLAPCTPRGVVKLIESITKIEGKKAVIVGRSNLVGKPLALMLLSKNATVTICHSKTENFEKETREADILIAAAGRAEMIKGEMVKKGAVVIDVGINRTDKGLVGDIDFKRVKNKASFITPVPGGVGPMTIACLLENTLFLAERNNNEIFKKD